ncbi:MAG TPA: hypothetical protein VJ829_01305 [Candidatus Binatia bacterium]|nr:hypothetical protein [Candidatus Binatia bacterium]
MPLWVLSAELALGDRPAHGAAPHRFAALVDALYREAWVVYVKRPFPASSDGR